MFTAKRIVILGAGNVAHHLTGALLENTINVTQIFNRTLDKAKKLANTYNLINYTNKISEIEKADIYIICTTDMAISEISYYIPFQDCLVVHTSGSTSMDSLKGKYRKGVFYPLQSFSLKRTPKYNEIPFLIEAEYPKDQELLLTLGKRISNETLVINSEKRLKIHLAAVWANNFSNHLFYLAGEICKSENIPPQILLPLIKETARKIVEEELSPYQAQTGPAKRNDTTIIEKHLQLLEQEPDLKKYQIYKLITESIFKTYNE